MNDPATALDRLVLRATQLYSLPGAAVKVLELTNNPRVDTRSLKECIENDPALTGKLLRVVNSSLFGLSREVSDLNQALALLGTKPLKLLVLGFSLPPGLFADLTGDLLARYWRHTLTKAVAARELSERVLHIPGDEAFLAGLLQDLGQLLLIQELGDPYVRFLDKVEASGRGLAEMERESLGFDHTTLTARLLAHWKLPEALVEDVAWRDPEEQTGSPPPERALAQVLRLAELLARLLADEDTSALEELLEETRQYRDFSQPQLKKLVSDLGEKVHQLADVLMLQLPSGVDYQDVLIRAHRQLAAVAEETAGDLVRRDHAVPARAAEESLRSEIEALAAAVAEISRRPASAPKPAKVPSHAREPVTVSAQVGSPAATPTRVSTTSTMEADPGVLGRLATAVTACRQSRCPLSLLLVHLDDSEGLLIRGGMKDYAKLWQLLGTVCAGLDHPGAVCVPHGEAGFAVILPDCDRRLGVELGNQLIREYRQRASAVGDGQHPTVLLGVGVANVALPPKNSPAEALFEAAQRCLFASGASGGGVVKSIEIY